jgi:hypothetical protein
VKKAAKKAVKKSAPKKTGRPTLFLPEYEAVARKLCLLGATDKDLAEAFRVTEQTINNWKLAHPGFFESLKTAKSELDEQVEQSLFQRAMGYSHEAVKILTVASHVEQIPYTEHYAPDTTACIFWLKNRQPDQWRDRHEVDHNVVGNLATLMREAEERVNGGQ